MFLSLALNFGFDYGLKKQLSQNEFVLEVEVFYDVSSTMELHFDTGKDFNPIQEVVKVVRKGENTLKFPFKVEEGEQLKFLRLDLGNETGLSKVQLKRMSLRSDTKLHFDLSQSEIARHSGLLNGVELLNPEDAIYKTIVTDRPFDPYIVFNPINELIYPLWKRTLLLILPWIVLLFFPVLSWVRERFEKKEFVLLLTTLFIASLPLKIAWVTFTSLLLLAYALFVLTKKKEIKFSPGRLAVFGLFLVPLLFLGQGEFSSLAIPLGFVIFPIICSIVDFSPYYNEIKKIHTKIFFVLTSIVVVNWFLFMGHKGYFYNSGISNYFLDIKSNVHWVMEWLYYSHPNFLSFFIIIGGIFCLDLFHKQKISNRYGIAYACLSFLALIILGSRFALALAFLIPVLYFIPILHLKRILIPLWAALFAGTVLLIDKLDLLRSELWQISFSEIKKNLWFGHGTGTSYRILPNELALEKNGSEALISINHSHNQFLTSLLENGLLSTMLMTVLLLIVFFQFANQNNKTMLLVTFSILLLMVVESPFQTATPLYLFSFLLCVFLDFKKVKPNK